MSTQIAWLLFAYPVVFAVTVHGFLVCLVFVMRESDNPRILFGIRFILIPCVWHGSLVTQKRRAMRCLQGVCPDVLFARGVSGCVVCKGCVRMRCLQGVCPAVMPSQGEGTAIIGSSSSPCTSTHSPHQPIPPLPVAITSLYAVHTIPKRGHTLNQ